MISYNVRPWCSPHLTTRPIPAREHIGAHPRHLPPQFSLHLHGQSSSIERPEGTQYVTSEIGSPGAPQVAAQTSSNVRTQTISHMFPPDLRVQASPNLRPQMTSLMQRSPLARPSATLQASPHAPSPTGVLASPQVFYPSGLHMHLQSRSRQLLLHRSPLISPLIRPSALTTVHNYLHSGPQAAQARHDPQNSSKMRVLTRPDFGPHRSTGIIPRHTTHSRAYIPIMKKSHSSPLSPSRQSSPSERTCSTDGRASVIVNAGVKSQPFTTPQ